MIVLVTGGSGSGKSAFAENMVVDLSESGRVPCSRYYIAAMPVKDAEDERRVARHRKLRAGKGFRTLEITESAERAVDNISGDEGSSAAAILESLSTLTANEMFRDGKVTDEGSTVNKVCRSLDKLAEGFAHLVIVTDNVFDDGCSYDEITLGYIRALGMISRYAAKIADEVWEVTAGCPVMIKGNI